MWTFKIVTMLKKQTKQSSQDWEDIVMACLWYNLVQEIIVGWQVKKCFLNIMTIWWNNNVLLSYIALSRVNLHISWSSLVYRKYNRLIFFSFAGLIILCCFFGFDIPLWYFLLVIPLLLAKDSLADSFPITGKFENLFGTSCLINFCCA